MRLWKCILLGALLVYLLVLYYFWKLQNTLDVVGSSENHVLDYNIPASSGIPIHGAAFLNRMNIDTSELAQIVTVVFREFEFFENDLPETIQSFLKHLPDVKIVILADAFPYPPLRIPAEGQRVSVVVLHPRVDEPSFLSQPQRYIDTPYVVLVPDSIRLQSSTQIRTMLNYLATHPNLLLVAASVVGEEAGCSRLTPKLREWTLEMHQDNGSVDCDSVQGTSVVLVNTHDLFNLAQPFARPFPYALFIQTTIRHWKVHILSDVVFQPGRPLFMSTHLKWKHSSVGRERFKMLYEDFGIKKVVHSPGEVEWFGCNKSTPRCFGTVVNDMPEYLFAGRWTPPCCLEGLRHTALHVFRTLKEANVRYWLEGGSLLGAARDGQIIPWDYDVDVGMYEEDLQRCDYLRDAAIQAVVTKEGFVWEKATEGDFFRVQYSHTNHLHVDIFPFFAREGIMTKRTWLATHRQDVEFPEHYLRPLTTITFLGMQVSAPNNIREFLELKFGESAIETLQYPDPKLMPFPNLTTASSSNRN